MYFYWFKRILSFKKSKKGNLGNRPDYNNRNDNDSKWANLNKNEPSELEKKSTKQKKMQLGF